MQQVLVPIFFKSIGNKIHYLNYQNHFIRYNGAFRIPEFWQSIMQYFGCQNSICGNYKYVNDFVGIIDSTSNDNDVKIVSRLILYECDDEFASIMCKLYAQVTSYYSQITWLAFENININQLMCNEEAFMQMMHLIHEYLTGSIKYGSRYQTIKNAYFKHECYYLTFSDLADGNEDALEIYSFVKDYLV